MKKLAGIVALLLLAASIPALADTYEGDDDEHVVHCTDKKDIVRPLALDVDGGTATGQYALPEEDPSTLVIFGHGYSHISDSWVEHMKRAARDRGVIAVAMDYRGSYKDPAGNNRGWFVKEGADDMIAATHKFQELCDSITQTIIFGVSMGGNSTGLAVARSAGDENAQGGPLFDYWFDVEGAVNVLETYAGATALAGTGNAFANNAKADIEQEMGGKTLAEDPEGYADLAVVSHIDEIANSGIKGVVLVHAIEDGLVPYNQAREFVPMLVSNGIPTEMFTAARKGSGEPGTTITGYSGHNDSPFAGHASETSTTHVVMVTALDRLWDLVQSNEVVRDYQEYFVDLELGTFPPR
jgi:acetyl esterase/lipase